MLSARSADDGAGASDAVSARRRSVRLLAVLGALTAVALAWAVLPMASWVDTGVRWVRTLGAWGPAVWFGVFVVLGAFSFPTTPLYVASGALFGFGGGVLVAYPAGILAATLSFTFARHFARDACRDRLERFPRFVELMESVESEGFRFVLLARLTPVVPAVVKNYGFGVTRISLGRFVAATALGQLPLALSYGYLGWAGGRTLAASDGRGTTPEVLLVVGALASLAFVGLLGWKARRAIRAS